MLLAEAFDRDDQGAEARDAYQQVVDRFPSSPLASTARARLGGRPSEAKLPLPAPAAAPVFVPPSGATPIGRFHVQVAAFTSVMGANQLGEQLRRQGIPAEVAVIRSGVDTLHAVRAGPYASKSVASEAAEQLKRMGYSVLIRP